MNTENRFLTVTLDARQADDAERTIPVTLSSEYPVERGMFREVLSHEPGAVDLSRSPLPVVESHNLNALNIGLVDGLRLVGRELKGRLKLGTTRRAGELWSDIRAGILRSVSIGYKIGQYTESDDGRELRATRWTPYEMSLVAAGADPTALIGRSKNVDKPTTDTTSTNTDNTTTDPTDRQRIEQEILTREQQRRKSIRGIYKLFEDRGDVAELTNRVLDDPSVSLEQARQMMLEHLARGAEPLAGRARIEVETGRDFGGYGGDQFRAAAVDALLLRERVPVKAPHPGAKDLQRVSLVEVAKTCLRGAGRQVDRMSNADAIRAAITHTTSDFPLLLSDLAAKALMAGFEQEPASHRQWCNFTSVQNFKDQHRIKLSEAPALELVNEGGEYTAGTFGEEAESYRLQTYGKVFTITRQAIVNDDLSAFTRVPQAFGQAGRRLEADLVYGILTTNPAMADSTALFHADHNNLLTGAVLSVASLGAAKAALRKQTGPAGGLLNIVPRFLIVPASLETLAESLIAAMRITLDSEEVENLDWIRALELVVEPRLDADSEISWYMAGSFMQTDTIECAHLDGQDAVAIEQEEGFDVAGLRIRASLDFAAKAIDWRGMVRNPGA